MNMTGACIRTSSYICAYTHEQQVKRGDLPSPEQIASCNYTQVTAVMLVHLSIVHDGQLRQPLACLPDHPDRFERRLEPILMLFQPLSCRADSIAWL